jgi:cell filamentation protein, protein adenylyltransferase
MTDSYWNAESDPYRYPGSPVLKNLPNIRNAAALEAFEQRATALRLDEMIVAIANMPIDFATWQMIHRILFQDVYGWAGQLRMVQLAKGDTVFAMPERIEGEGKRIFDMLAIENLTALNRNQFASRLAYYFGELNVLHPFREGNGRTQKLLFDEIARRAGYTIDWSKMDVDALLEAVIAAFHKQNYAGLEKLFNVALQAVK